MRPQPRNSKRRAGPTHSEPACELKLNGTAMDVPIATGAQPLADSHDTSPALTIPSSTEFFSSGKEKAAGAYRSNSSARASTASQGSKTSTCSRGARGKGGLVARVARCTEQQTQRDGKSPAETFCPAAKAFAYLAPRQSSGTRALAAFWALRGGACSAAPLRATLRERDVWHRGQERSTMWAPTTFCRIVLLSTDMPGSARLAARDDGQVELSLSCRPAAAHE